MAKKLFPYLVIFFTISCISCTKDYSCECTVGTSTSTKGFYPDAKKKDAQEACDRVQASYAANNTTATCTIK